MENNKDIYFAPVIIPTMCRSAHFIRLVESLKRNSWAKFTTIYVMVDYPSEEKYKAGWLALCDYLEKGDFSVFADFVVFKRDKNMGSWANINFLVQYAIERHECWIYTDDDMEFSPNFLEYMDKLLWQCKDDPSVICVSGYSHPLPWKLKEGANCLKQNFIASTWGTGFWKKKYRSYSSYIESGKLLKEAGQCIANGRYKQMTKGCFRDYFSAALSFGSQTFLFKTCSDISFRAYLACKEAFCVFPALSLSRNFGFDGTGEYCSAVNEFGENTMSYNYSSQKIDDSDSFDVVLDDSLEFLTENRDLESRFDDRSPEEMKQAIHNFELVKRWGYTIAKLIHGYEFILSKIRRER